MAALQIRELREDDRSWATKLVMDYFSGPLLISLGVAHDTRQLPGLVAERDGERVGLVQYAANGREAEVVVLMVTRQRQGIGRRLLEEMRDVAARAGIQRLWLLTTNDNLPAQEFYRRVGWRQVRVHHGSVDAARKLKPAIPLYGHSGVAIHDDIEFELLVASEA